MSSHYQFFKETAGNRDTVFQHALSFLNKAPANFLEIGSLRRTGIEARHGDGYSTFHYAEHVRDFGGNLTVCDIDPNAVAAAMSVVSPEFPFVNYYCCDGKSLLGPQNVYDFVYLDGSDDPRDMLAEFELCKSKLILCDDFSSKGILLKKKYPEYFLYFWEGHGHEMALYGIGSGKSAMPFIQKP